MIHQIKKLLEKRIGQYVGEEKTSLEEVERKRKLLSERGAEIVKVKVRGKIAEKIDKDHHTEILYQPHFLFLIRQGTHYYIEEEIENRRALFSGGVLIQEWEEIRQEEPLGLELNSDFPRELERIPFQYNRHQAVQYAERWWNSYNPQFKKFDVDCTNYVSQCLWAGGAPMRGFPDRSKGWWYQEGKWSYSWSVAHSLRWYLASSKIGLRAKEVPEPGQLLPGDVICYDFQGDGRYDHTTIVVAKDANGMPLVNAHTYNSRMRYWSYKDSSAYTDRIQYKFYSIVDDSE